MGAAPRFLLALGALACLAASTASAQRPQTREGFWIGFGFGGGSAGLSCNTSFDPDCANLTRETGFTGHLKMGGTLSPKVLIGGESTAWTKDEQGLTSQLGNLAAAVYFYPAPATGFFVKGGPSFSYHRSDDGTTNLTGTGFGFIIGAGYDVRVGRNISISPVANFYWGSVGELSSNGASTSGFGLKQNVFDFQLGITFH
ncbi:MAG TPA: outer membrane beta-barrel protein [Gemmatimonadales bacterium]|nr:outer membrane beta-barrel protein [Gemmatimonadales bacterium]